MRRSPVPLLLPVVLAAALSVPAPAGASPAREARAIEAYDEARSALFALEADAKRRRYRHHWLALAKRFDAMGERKDHPRRCEALYNAGRLYTGLAELSYLNADRREAVERYRLLARSCSRSNLADDALLKAAELLVRLGDPEAARVELERLFRQHPDGDMAPRARSFAAEWKLNPRRPESGTAKAAAGKGEGGKGAAPRQANAGKAAGGTGAAPRQADAGKAAGGKGEGRTGAASRTAGAVAAVAPTGTAGEAPRAGAAPEPGAGEPADPLGAIIAAVAAGADPAGGLAPAVPGPEGAAPETAAGAPANPDPERLRLLADLERSATGDLTLSTLAGLQVRRVVLDPGHGGKDPGAIGKRGTRESHVALAIAKKLRRHLENLGLEVLLTREDDTTLSLEERTAFANERRADLFLSIHCNAAENRKLRGIETYTLNLNSDRYAMRLAARENAGSERSVGDLQLILADLATKANTDDSVRLATAIHEETVSRLGKKWKDVKDLGTKQALFFVLLGAKMPAVLLETSFLSHPEEEARLRTDAYQEEIARGIAGGVRRFLADREAVARAPGPTD